MACLITDGISKGCRDNIGGISTVYLANIELLSAVTFGTGILTDISTKTALGAASAEFFEFQVNKVSSSWTDNGAPVANNGGTFYTPSITMVFGKNEATKVNTVKLLGQGVLVAIVKNNDGKYFLLGSTPTSAANANGTLGNGLEIASSNYSSGTAYGDLNGWTITLTGGEPEPSYEVPANLITDALIHA